MSRRKLFKNQGSQKSCLQLRNEGLLPTRIDVTLVYIRDEKYTWLPAQIIERNDHITDSNNVKHFVGKGKAATVIIDLPDDWHESTMYPDFVDRQEKRVIDLNEYPGKELPLQNVDEYGDVIGQADMADLSFLHEAAVLYNLKVRHYEGFPYTRVGDITIAVNPYVWMDDLYSKAKQQFYASKIIWDQKKNENISSSTSSPPHPLFDASLKSRQTFIDVDSFNEFLSYPPHIYETSSLAYRGLAVDGENQTILVSGESGAGKTETVKLVMSYLATVQSTCTHGNNNVIINNTIKHTNHPTNIALHEPMSMSIMSTSMKSTLSESVNNFIVEDILLSNPLFEAFGNAKTSRNSNSSRFGKFTQLQFEIENGIGEGERIVHQFQDGSVKSFLSNRTPNMRSSMTQKVPECMLSGSRFITYLLEKSRVVTHDSGERNYHIFYQIIDAPENEKVQIWHGLANTTTESFSYFGRSETETIEGKTDRENWKETVKALKKFGMKGHAFTSLMRGLCIVLQLGNIVFGPDPSDPEVKTIITSQEEFQKVSDLMGIDRDDLSNALTHRQAKTGRGIVINFSLTPAEAKEGCDALAKEIYSHIFDYLVKIINGTIDRGIYYLSDNIGSKTGNISMLDIFGFESFVINRFEQLCINYANERLQQKYVTDIFRVVTAEYEKEGIQIFDLKTVDNIEIVKLFEGRLGLLATLTEECMLPKGNETSFVYKLLKVNESSEPLLKNKLLLPHEFQVSHFAGVVKYDARKFVERNKDALPIELINVACKSKNSILSAEFTRMAERINNPGDLKMIGRKSSKGKKTMVVSKFKSQLSQLLSSINKTRTRYIRCIKPNAEKLPRVMDHEMAIKQLNSAGIVTAITVSRETFPNNLPYEQVIDRFKCLVLEDMKSSDLKEKTKKLLNVLLKKREKMIDGKRMLPFACGKTKVFFRAGSLELLESSRVKLFRECATRVQTICRLFFVRSKYLSLKQATIVVQSIQRMRVLRNSYVSTRIRSIIVQCKFRQWIARKRYLHLRIHNSAVRIQSIWRSTKCRDDYVSTRLATISLQRVYRSRRYKQHLDSSLAKLVAQAKLEHDFKKLSALFSMKNVKGAKNVSDSVKEKMLQDSERYLHYFQDQITKLRSEVTDLRCEAQNERTAKNAYKRKHELVESQFNSFKIETAQTVKKNDQLMRKAKTSSEEIAILKKELKEKKIEYEESINLQCDKQRETEEEKKKEIKILRSELNLMNKRHEISMHNMKKEMKRNRTKHHKDVKMLQSEIHRVLKEHDEDLSRMFEAMETMRSSNEAIKEVDEFAKSKYLLEIEDLKKDIALMEKMHMTEINGFKMKLHSASSTFNKPSIDIFGK